MDSTKSKVSFIPKGSLIREESFLERKRPRSVIGFIATFLFIAAVSSYTALFYYNDLLNQTITKKTDEIKNIQEKFTNAPEVEEAKIFRSRVELAREILNSHTVTSPVFDFLSKNTTASILYNQFSFSQDPVLGSVLELSGEAPTYAALAYQADVLREKKNELLGFSINNVDLTNFGTISFSLTLTFKPDYLLYIENFDNMNAPILNTEDNTPDMSTTAEPSPSETTSTPDEATTTTETSQSLEVVDEIPTDSVKEETLIDNIDNKESSSTDWVVSSNESTTSTSSTIESQSFLKSLWLRLKFW